MEISTPFSLFHSHGAFLITDGLEFIIWLGSAVPPEFVAQLLGMEAAKTADISNVRFNYPTERSKYRMLHEILRVEINAKGYFITNRSEILYSMLD